MTEYWARKAKRIYGSAGRITDLELADASGDFLKPFEWYSVKAIIEGIYQGHRIFTCTKGSSGYNKGSEIHPYLHTDANSTTADNLHSLPINQESWPIPRVTLGTASSYWVRETRRLTGASGRITQLDLSDPTGTAANFQWLTIQAVIEGILKGATIHTCTRIYSGFTKGAEIHPSLHTDPNGKPGDNLDSLPAG